MKNPNSEPFKRADALMELIDKRLIKLFGEFKTGMKFDELNVLKTVSAAYAEIREFVEEQYRELAKATYDDMWAYLLVMGLLDDEKAKKRKAVSGESKAVTEAYTEIADARKENRKPKAKAVKAVTKELVNKLLDGYNPVSGYVFRHELERKAAKLAESILAAQTTGDRDKAIDKAMRQLSGQLAEYADQVVSETTKDAYESAGITLVKWKTKNDSKVCQACDELNGQVFEFEKVPPKPHFGCRCWLTVVYSEGKTDA